MSYFNENWNGLTHLSPTFPAPNFTYFHSTVVELLYTKRWDADITHILAIFPFVRPGCVPCFDTPFPGNRLLTTGPTEIVAQSCFATPGRLNQTSFSINRPGLLYGQCSEICGANHRFIPTVIERVSTNQFIN